MFIWEEIASMKGSETEKLNLKREVGLVSAVSLIGGIIIGSGIFMSPQYVLANVGSPGASLVIWAVCGIVSTLAALSYAELGTIIKESGGDFIYVLRIYGAIPAFFVAFTFVLVVRPMGITAIALSFSEYAVAPFYPGCTPPELVVKSLAVTGILVVSISNILNVRFTMAIQVVFMVAKVVGLLIIAIGGVVTLAQGNFGSLQNTETAFQNTQLAVSPIGMALYQGLWSFAGWYNLNNVTEELKKPEVRSAYFLKITKEYCHAYINQYKCFA
uniref:Zmp:0000001267 n=1 Tax=Denticeps clupeoides TaxID=299321 RepID=A0AAY4AJG9_9TELE